MADFIPPHSNDAENAIIWCYLLDSQEDYSQLSTDDFYNPQCAKMFEILEQMKSDGKPIDMVTVSDEIKNRKLSDIDWFRNQNICDYSTWIFTTAWVTQYIKTIKSHSRSRKAQRIGDKLLYLSDLSPENILELSQELSQVASIWFSKDESVSYDDVTSAYEQVTSRFGKSLYGFSFWQQFSFMDENTKWLQRKMVYRIGAPSNTGKTQFVYNIIPELLQQKNEEWKPLKIAFFTLENSKENTLLSVMCNSCWLNYDKLNKGEVEWNWDYLVDLKSRLYVIDDCYELSKIFSKVSMIKPDVVILDYISHVSIKGFTEENKYAEYARLVPQFAKSQNLVWIDLSNLPKSLQTNEEIRFRPWFHGSALLMNNCDVAIHIMRNEGFKKTKDKVNEEWYNRTKEDLDYFKTRNMLDVVITKNRWWPVWVETIYWLNYENWGKWIQLTKKDLDNLWAKFW